MPQLLLVNRFSILAIEKSNTSIDELIDIPLSPSNPNTKVPVWRPKWEKKLPK